MFFPTFHIHATSSSYKHLKTIKMKKLIKLGVAALLTAGIFSVSSCKKYRKYDNMEVVEDTYSGNMTIGSTGADPGGDFTGSGDSGTYSFVWKNSEKTADVNFDITTSGGSVQMILNDAKGKEVFNNTRTSSSEDTFSGTTDEGAKGKWLVTIKLTNFNGDGSFSISPGN